MTYSPTGVCRPVIPQGVGDLPPHGRVQACHTAPRGGGATRGYRGKVRMGSTPHASQQIKGKGPHLRHLECIGRQGGLGLGSPRDTHYAKAAGNDPAHV